MTSYLSLVTFYLASFTAGAAFTRRAPYLNTTSIPALSLPTQTPPISTSLITPEETGLHSANGPATEIPTNHDILRPTDTVTLHSQTLSAPSDIPPSSPGYLLAATSQLLPTFHNGTPRPSTGNSSAACTINIYGASLDYWFMPTYSYPVGTMKTSALNFSNSQSLTLVPPTATFDVTSALSSDFACTSTESYISAFDFTLTMCEEYTVRPSAAATSVVYRSEGYAPFPPGGVIPLEDVPLYDLYNPDLFTSATAVVTLAPNVTQSETSATPFVYFTAYEVETGNETKTVQLPLAQAYPYSLENLEEKDTANGPLPEGFLDQTPYSECHAGQLQATVTVLIVVNLYYLNRPNQGPLFSHLESSVIGFNEPLVLVNGHDTTSGVVPLTVADWDIPGTGPKPTDDNFMANNLPSPASAAQVRGPASVTVGSIGTNPIIIGPSSKVVVGSQTLQPGGSAINVGGTPVSLAPSPTAIFVGDKTSQLPQIFPSPAPPVLTVGPSTLTPNAATQFFITPGQTLTPGGVATVDGTIVSLAPSASFVVIGGSTQILPISSAPLPITTRVPQFVVGDSTIVAQPTQVRPDIAPTFVVSEQTLLPGGAAVTFSGTTLSLDPSGSVLVVNGASSTVQAETGAAWSPPAITVGNQIFSALQKPSEPVFVVADKTLIPGGPAITVSGTTLSLASSASFVVINDVTSTLIDAAPSHVSAPPLTIGDVTFRPLPGTATAYLIGSILLSAGGSIVTSGTTISLASGATALVVNGQTSSILPQVPPVITNPPLLTIDAETYSAVSGGGTVFVIGGETLAPGGTITVDGTTISLAIGATELIYGSSGRSTTTALFPATPSQSQHITSTSGLSASARTFDGQATATSRKGAASRLSSQLSMSITFIVLVYSVLV
ncbi:hypothetical protein PSV08DRAFT_385118 [Bipolaris maydis]|uniref:uncharacterized protein n=1 Tax=Cochliobolus heterostrophus TaxID=5016 RepID=UPI0024D2C45D|nr:hypothetical protein J3E73DRAFT_428983 [Bipolaris maydis]KAJ6275270.1 hypothetical protein PSV08DRAFT_385118 [Bipolaris maydis]KAJ6285440.1 hypothetical protein J3E71DRAFT_373534 [Bipolaris maydis]